MSSSLNSSGMPSLYDTSTSTASVGSRGSGFFPKSHPRSPSSFYHQYSLASAAKKASGTERLAQSELGQGVSAEMDRPRGSQEHVPQHKMYTHSEPGIVHSKSGETARFSAYVNRFAEMDPRMDHRRMEENRDMEAKELLKARALANRARFQKLKDIQESQAASGESPDRSAHSKGSSRGFTSRERGRSPESHRSYSSSQRDTSISSDRGSIDSLRRSARSRSRSTSSTRRLSSNIRMEPSSSLRYEGHERQSSLRRLRRSPSPAPGGSGNRGESIERSSNRSVEGTGHTPIGNGIQTGTMHERRPSRTRDLAERFERTQDNPMTPSAWEAAHPHPNHAPQDDYKDRVEIVTPSPASVRDLKQKLWDDGEHLHNWHLHEKRKLNYDEDQQGNAAAARQKGVSDHTSNPSTVSTIGTNGSGSRTSVSPRGVSLEDQKPSFLLQNSRYCKAAERVAPGQNSPPPAEPAPSQHPDTHHSSNEIMPRQPPAAPMQELPPRNPVASRASTTQTLYSKAMAKGQDPEMGPVNKTDGESVGLSNKSVASLLARLNAVKRDDPSAALAEIDAILRANSNSSDEEELAPVRINVVTSSNTPQRDLGPPTSEREVSDSLDPKLSQPDEDNEDEESTTDETSVSSITNPTYQGLPSTRNKRLSYRQQRPSILQSYGTTPRSIDLDRRSRRKDPKSPPPATISLSSKERNRKVTSKNSVQSSQDVGANTPVELAQKIKRWDEISTPGTPEEHAAEGVDPESSPSQIPNMPSNRRRAHPWDTTIPGRSEIETRDTSMESASGVEAQSMSRATVARGLSVRNLGRENSPATAPESDRSTRFGSRKPNEDGGSGFSFDRNTTPSSKGQDSSWDSAPRLTQQQQEKANSMSNDFDSAWVSLPKSSFFQERQADVPDVGRQPHSQMRSSMSSLVDDNVGFAPAIMSNGEDSRSDGQQSFTTESFRPARVTREHQSHSVLQTPSGQVYDPAIPRPRQTFSPRTHEPRRNFQSLSPHPDRDSDMSDTGVEVTLVKNKPKSRGLRSFLPKRRQLNKETVVLDQTSSSLGRQAPLVDAMDLEAPPPQQQRGRLFGKSSDRGRSRSLEDGRIRNPNIAKKFGRLLRVYDSEKDSKGFI